MVLILLRDFRRLRDFGMLLREFAKSAFWALAAMAGLSAQTVRAVSSVIAPLPIVNQRAQVEQVVAVLRDGAGNQLARLGGGESWAFF